MAAKIFEVLCKRLPDESRLFEAALSAYASSSRYDDSAWNVRHFLAQFETLTKGQVEQVMGAFHGNSQNESSRSGMSSLKPLLEKWTGERWTVINDELVPTIEVKPLEDDVPF